MVLISQNLDMKYFLRNLLFIRPKRFIVLILGLLLIVNFNVFAQNPKEESNKFLKRNSLQIELFGSGGAYSISYERVIFNRDKNKISVQIGTSVYPESIDILPLFVPFSLNKIFSFEANHFEFGIGQVLVYDEPHYNFLGTLKIGYRHQKPNSKFCYKILFTPFIDTWDNHNVPILDKSANLKTPPNFFPWGGVSFGYNF